MWAVLPLFCLHCMGKKVSNCSGIKYEKEKTMVAVNANMLKLKYFCMTYVTTVAVLSPINGSFKWVP